MEDRILLTFGQVLSASVPITIVTLLIDVCRRDPRIFNCLARNYDGFLALISGRTWVGGGLAQISHIGKWWYCKLSCANALLLAVLTPS